MVPKIASELSDAAVRRLTVGKHSVGGVAGLMLRVTDTGARGWVLRTTAGGRRRDLGLGAYPSVTLAQARQRAREVREGIWRGTDPIAERKLRKSAILAEQSRAVTFGEIAAEYVAKKSREFKTPKQHQKLANQLALYALPKLGRMVVADVARAHVVAVLQPIWETKNETASRVRLYIERIMDLAEVKGLRAGDNPARWKGNLELSFPARNKVARTQHYAALSVADMTEFVAKLSGTDTVAAKALHFAILTASRSQEVREATWGEIDTDKRLWVVPAERMKGGKKHSVPLTADAMAVLISTPRRGDLIFPSSRGGVLPDYRLSTVPKDLGYPVTAHGFRATFRTWAQEHTGYAEEVVELCLAHVNSDATRAAYARSELIDKRRLLMDDWALFCRHGAPTGEVIAIWGRG